MRFLSATGLLAAAFALQIPLVAAAHNVVDLSDQRWTLTSPGNDTIKIPGKVPSHAHIDLYAAKVIDNPLIGLNDFDLRWIAFSNWTYSTELRGVQNSKHLQTSLIFNGLDTYAAIEFCGQHIGNTDNQFRQWVFDISHALASCKSYEPLLEVKFGSTPNISAVIAAEPGQETWPDGVDEVYEFPNRQFVRKEQSDFGWDWGPAFMPAGIWQPAYLIQLDGPDSVYVKNSDFDLYRKGQLNNLPPDQTADWIFNASIDVVGSVPRGSQMRYTIVDSDSHRRVSNGRFGQLENGGDVITGIAALKESDYELWWPNGLGPQKLYNMEVEVVFGGRTIASVNKRMGFRTIVLNMEPISDLQLSQDTVHFEINGHTFYSKGANFVPPDPFWPRVTPDHIKGILTDVVDGHQNMLRVWSSGAYSPDFMYDLADEMGVLLWCEFEFSVSLYPANPEFLENVRQEAVYQVRRTNHHPSMALWAGGNEMEKDELPAIRSDSPELYEKYLNEYLELFLNTLLPAVYGNSHSISYMPCSTNNGYLELDFNLTIPFVDRLYNTTPGYLYGDSDFYDYNAAQAFDINQYVVNRFANEFGFPSEPSLETWREAIPEDQLYFNSTMAVLRNHHYPPGSLATDEFDNPLKGQGEMTLGVEYWYPIPNKTDSVANFSAWCHTTQIFQADFLHTKIQYYRAGSSMPQRQLGSLYWQLNDIWQAPTWSSREYDGRWKVLFYTTKDIYQPIILAPVYNVTTGVMDLYAVSDLWSVVEGEASWEWIGYDGKPVNTSLSAKSQKFTVGAVNATVLTSMNITDLTSSGSLPADNAVLVATVTASGSPPNSKATMTYTHSNFFTATPLGKAKLVDPGLTLLQGRGSFIVTAEKGVSAFTWLALDPKDAGVIVVFDDNGFLLRKGESKTVGYRISSGESPGWETRVTVESIWNNTLPE
ncbi:glycoside hydrolase family 2 protein [Penicillium lagena]|uniref:glycoside hydrolase family 2 protein n=1 Tax=Penicillium lagena TaxID=94218 RepID=UPI00253F67F4|nr:glycoside hydrolase family 2 protein [Penicillium lagena]KAJ5618756.1 glycoside hydrolase family 2 protein [Penicillium lagena]